MFTRRQPSLRRAFQSASSVSNGLDVLNVLILGTLPAEANGPSNLAIRADAFVNAIAHDRSIPA